MVISSKNKKSWIHEQSSYRPNDHLIKEEKQRPHQYGSLSQHSQRNCSHFAKLPLKETEDDEQEPEPDEESDDLR